MPIQQYDDVNKRSAKSSAHGAAFYTRQQYVKDGTQTLVASECPLSDQLLWYLIDVVYLSRKHHGYTLLRMRNVTIVYLSYALCNIIKVGYWSGGRSNVINDSILFFQLGNQLPEAVPYPAPALLVVRL